MALPLRQWHETCILSEVREGVRFAQSTLGTQPATANEAIEGKVQKVITTNKLMPHFHGFNEASAILLQLDRFSHD